MKMTFISKFVVISLISLLLRTSLAEISTVDVCEIKDNFGVVGAVRVGDYLLLIIKFYNYKTEEYSEYEVVRTVYFDSKVDNEDNKYKAQRVDLTQQYWTEFFGDITTVKFMFTFNAKEQGQKSPIYLRKSDGNTTKITIRQETTIRSERDRPFEILYRPSVVYNGHQDISSFVNLKLLHSYFPKGVEILDMIMVRGHVSTKLYMVLVYTSEKLDNEQYIYRRHALEGHEFEVQLTSSANPFERMNWTDSDWNDQANICQQLGSRITSAAVTKVVNEYENIIVDFIEFYAYVFVKNRLLVFLQDTPSGKKLWYQLESLSTTDDKGPEYNTAILNCPTEHIKLNLTALEKLPLEGKPYDPNLCLPFVTEVFDFYVSASALYQNKYLILLGSVVYNRTSNPSIITGGSYIFMVRYIDTELDIKFYETQVMTTRINSGNVEHSFDVVFRDEQWGQYFDYRGMFDFTPDKNEITFREGVDGTIAKQIQSELIYLFKYNDRVDKSIDVTAVEIHYDMSDTNPQNFRIHNHKVVYNHKRQTEDKSGYLNLKLFSMHFPSDVEILDIIIFRRDIKGSVKYNAFVYTEEQKPDESKHQVRHYMKGTPTHFQSVDYSYWRLSWEFDSNLEYCRKLWFHFSSASKLIEYKTRTGVAFKVIEFSRSYHRIIKVIFNESDVFEITEDGVFKGVNNTVLYNCKARPEHLLQNQTVSDCYANPKLKKGYKKEFDVIREKEPRPNLQEVEEVSPLFWQLLICLALIIAIIALIAFGIYLRSVGRKLDDQDYN